MTKTLRAFGVAASLLMGTALAASAAVTADPQGNTAPTATTSTGTQYTNTQAGGSAMAPGYAGDPTTPKGPAASSTPKVDRGNAEGAGGGAGH